MTEPRWPSTLDAQAGARLVSPTATRFAVWAPNARAMDVSLASRVVRMEQDALGWWEVVVEGAGPGARYSFSIEGAPSLPDPASRSQPDGVHGRSEIVDLSYRFTDDGWSGPVLSDLVVYELHAGTFSPAGTFEGIEPALDDLVDLGINAIELLPVSQFPGSRNWGYDGVFPYAVHNTYGGPRGLQRLVDACHARGVAVILDVVFNHLGPEGNRLADYGPFFTDRYGTPWGSALNFDGPHSDEVRRFFGGAVRQWFVDFHIDGLRLDAVHEIHDETARPFLAELSAAVDDLSVDLGRSLHLIAESNRNDPRFVTPREAGGLGLHAQWSDDFHHALRARLTGERTGYYADFGTAEDLRKCLEDGFVYDGAQRSIHRAMRFGAPAAEVPGERFVVFARNHDQIGNQADGVRLTKLLSFDHLKVAAGLVMCSPFVPMLFMGEEYGETAPFLYFVDHSDPELLEAVRRGRQEEFASFGWRGDPPDPADPASFEASKLDRSQRLRGDGAGLHAWYRQLLTLRRSVPALGAGGRDRLTAEVQGDAVLVLTRWTDSCRVHAYANLDDTPRPADLPVGSWRVLLDSGDERFAGGGPSVPTESGSRRDMRVELPAGAFVVLLSGDWIPYAGLAG